MQQFLGCNWNYPNVVLYLHELLCYAGGYKDEASVVELFAEDPKFNNILSRLDEKTMHNYKNLAKEFKINTLKIDQLGMRFSGGPTAFLFYYMSFTEGLKDLTMHQLRKHFEEMKLIKLAKIVTKATNEGLYFCLFMTSLAC